MTFLKISTLVLGLFSVNSANVTLTPMPSMDQCKNYLAWEYKDTSARTDKMKLLQADGILTMSMKNMFSSYHATYECIEVQ